MFLEELIITQLVKEFPAIYGNPKLLRLKKRATGPYPDPDASSPHLLTNFPNIHFNIILPSTPRSSDGLVCIYLSISSPLMLSP
jgi:hypothetical protein